MPRLSRFISLVVAAATFGLGGPQTARADMTANLVRILCAPEISFFQLETFGLWNIEIGKLKPTHGIMTIRELYEAPPKCRTGDRTIRLVVYHHEPGNGECGGVEWARIAIWIDGDEVDTIENTHMAGHCASERPYPHHQVSVTQNRYMRCTTAFEEYENTIRQSGTTVLGMSCTTVHLN